MIAGLGAQVQAVESAAHRIFPRTAAGSSPVCGYEMLTGERGGPHLARSHVPHVVVSIAASPQRARSHRRCVRFRLSS